MLFVIPQKSQLKRHCKIPNPVKVLESQIWTPQKGFAHPCQYTCTQVPPWVFHPGFSHCKQAFLFTNLVVVECVPSSYFNYPQNKNLPSQKITK